GDGEPQPRFSFPPSLPPGTLARGLAETGNAFLAPGEPGLGAATEPAPPEASPDAVLGTARAQLHGTYILAETATGIVLADELAEWGDAPALQERVESVCGTLACHSSVRAGRRLAPAEMDALLRQMEVTPNSGQCNHGRPTFVTLALSDIERLFGRR